jgi:hypothetical protein
MLVAAFLRLKGDERLDEQIRSTFPRVTKRQRCHVNERDGYMPGYVSSVFDGGFLVQRDDGNEIRVLEAAWTEDDAKRFLWLTRNGKSIKKRWWRR